MTMTQTEASPVKPFEWKDKPSLIEKILSAQKISAEAQRERKAGPAQTLTALGSYWKGRKPLILNKACILGALLPATDDPEADLEVFELLMAIDDESFKRRVKSQRDIEKLASLNYLDKLTITKRPEECDDAALYGPIWKRVNQHFGISSTSMTELVEQLGILRFGHRPKVADTFCGGGSIPFEAARLGCDVYASDLNPIACMLTWGALNIVGADEATRQQIEQAQRNVSEAVDSKITALGIEHDAYGNRAKAYLYCLEIRCPQTGWKVPVLPTFIISKGYKVRVYLKPNYDTNSFDIEVVSNCTESEMKDAEIGTYRDNDVVYCLDGEEYRTPIKTLRGDYKTADGINANRLRRWELRDFMPRPDDIFQERLYCIQWITKETLGKSRQESFFSRVTEEDLARERQVEAIVQENLAAWQEQGLVPDMPIEPGYNTDQPIRERGWTYWHHLFSPRQILMLALMLKETNSCLPLISETIYLRFGNAANYLSKLTPWATSGARPTGGPSDNFANTFYNQALNTQYMFGTRSWLGFQSIYNTPFRSFQINSENSIKTATASQIDKICDLYITDPPYADAVHYHEITEFFIAWLRKKPPREFANWTWDSRRSLAIKGDGEDFRREMIAAYKAMADHMPDNGLQIVMFTHQDAGVWADMASIVWGAGLRVTAAWYIATETTSELKKGGYVQGTVLLVLRKRLTDEAVYRDELIEEVKAEVARQIDSMVGLNQTVVRKRRNAVREAAIIENLFEDADLQMAGYAAALRVLTNYRRIDGMDMAAEALRPNPKGERNLVRDIIDFAVQVANEHLVPEGLTPGVWERCTGPERFYLKMLDIEGAGIKKLDNYQNFAKAFRVADYGSLMGSMKANDARLKSALDFKKAGFEGDFGKSPLRAVLFALYELQRELDSDEVMEHLRYQVAGYHTRREDLMALCQFLASKRERTLPDESAAARVLLTRIKNERLGE